jgi:hypothetical protein
MHALMIALALSAAGLMEWRLFTEQRRSMRRHVNASGTTSRRHGNHRLPKIASVATPELNPLAHLQCARARVELTRAASIVGHRSSKRQVCRELRQRWVGIYE